MGPSAVAHPTQRRAGRHHGVGALVGASAPAPPGARRWACSTHGAGAQTACPGSTAAMGGP
eukprot:2475031-Lingulodinium_polyedra.AAC.1